MLNDRNYYRQCDDGALITLALEGDSELALVLAERLGDANFAKDHADSRERMALEDRIAELEDELSEARNTINYLETELENAQ